MNLPPDFKELLEEFDRDAVEFVLIGGYAVAFHGRPRATKDIDLVVLGTADNLARAATALRRFGAPPNVVTAIAALQESEVVFMGQAPLRVDFMRTIDGVVTAALFAEATETELDGIRIKVISLDHLIANKRAADRPQDRIDADFLEKIRARNNQAR